jgi:hypothetical protein
MRGRNRAYDNPLIRRTTKIPQRLHDPSVAIEQQDFEVGVPRETAAVIAMSFAGLAIKRMDFLNFS